MTDKGITLVPGLDTDSEDDAPVSGGTFTADQVSTIVQERLNRYKRKAAGESERSKADLAALTEQLEKATARLAKYDEQSKVVLEGKRKGLPESVTKLLDKLEPDEQLAWIEENGASIVAPEKPVSSGPEAPKPNTAQPGMTMTGNVSETGLHYGI